MKSLNWIIFILIFPILIYGQEDNSKINLKIAEITSQIKVIDSIGNFRNEGISEGDVRYTHIAGDFGWETYFLNEIENKNTPLRIRYSETKPLVNENLNMYYQNGVLIFAELIRTPISEESKNDNPILKHFYFDGNTIIYDDLTDSDIDYILEKEQGIRKTIYK